jgi:hypothetical protein
MIVKTKFRWSEVIDKKLVSVVRYLEVPGPLEHPRDT